MKCVHVPREVEKDRGNMANIDFRMDLLREWSFGSQAKSKNSTGKDKVAQKT